MLDISMPRLNGLDLARRHAAEYPAVKDLALTVHEYRAYARPRLHVGANGSLLKRSAAEDLVRAVRAVADGGIYLTPVVADKALPDRPMTAGSTAGRISPRETDVLRLTAQGLSNKAIADRLDVSAMTMETYKARASEKLGCARGRRSSASGGEGLAGRSGMGLEIRDELPTYRRTPSWRAVRAARPSSAPPEGRGRPACRAE